jgi:hypothetical protein
VTPGNRAAGGSSPDPSRPVAFEDLAPEDMVAAADDGPPIVGMAGALNRLIAKLTVRPDGIAPSVILVAPTGSGKTTLVRRLAREVLRSRRRERPDLPITELFQLQLSVLLAGASYQGQLENRYRALVEACRVEGRYLFIDEIHTMDLMGRSEGGLPWLQTLKLDMDSGRLRLIGATTPIEYNLHLSNDPAAERRFFRFDVEPFSFDEVVSILEDSVRRFSGVRVSCERRAIEDAAALIHHDVAQPGLGKKALVDIAGEKLALASDGAVEITRSDVDAYASRQGLQKPLSDRLPRLLAASGNAFADGLQIIADVAEVIGKEWARAKDERDPPQSGGTTAAREAGGRAVATVQEMLHQRLGEPRDRPGGGYGILAAYVAPRTDELTLHLGYCLLKKVLQERYDLRFMGGGGSDEVRRKTDFVRAVSTGLFYSDRTASVRNGLEWNGIRVTAIADELLSSSRGTFVERG